MFKTEIIMRDSKALIFEECTAIAMGDYDDNFVTIKLKDKTTIKIHKDVILVIEYNDSL